MSVEIKIEDNNRQLHIEFDDISIDFCIQGFSLYRNGKLLHETHYPQILHDHDILEKVKKRLFAKTGQTNYITAYDLKQILAGKA